MKLPYKLQNACVVFQRLTAAHFLLGANIFLTSSGLIKLGDFGCSVKLKNNAQTMPGEVNSTLGTAGGSGEVRLCPGAPSSVPGPCLSALFLVHRRGECSGLLARRGGATPESARHIGKSHFSLKLTRGKKSLIPFPEKPCVSHWVY